LSCIVFLLVTLGAIGSGDLERAREQGKRAVCLSNLKQLTLAWILYADENKDKLVNGAAGIGRKKDKVVVDKAWTDKDWADDYREGGRLDPNEQKEAIKAGKFDKEIVPIEIPQRKGDAIIFKQDEDVRETSLEKLAKLKAVFIENGTVTAGNAPGCNDGAAALLLMSKKKALKKGYKPLAEIVSYTGGGIEPKLIMVAPAVAVRKLLKKNKRKIKEYNLIEANEAFSAQALAVQKELKFADEVLNVNGGAVALGHPIGASGARVLTTLVYAMQDRKKDIGLAALCLGGGNAVAMEIKRYK